MARWSLCKYIVLTNCLRRFRFSVDCLKSKADYKLKAIKITSEQNLENKIQNMNRTYTQRKQSFTDRLHQWFYWNSNTVPVNKYFLFLPNYSYSQIILKRLIFMRSRLIERRETQKPNMFGC